MADYTSRIPSKSVMAAETKLYILDKGVSGGRDPEWVDFSGVQGHNALRSVGQIKNMLEVDLGALVTTVQNAILDNSDGFFSQPFPATLQTVQGNTAVFNITTGYKRSVLRGCYVKITVQTRVPNTPKYDATETFNIQSVDGVQEDCLGVFYIDDVTPDITKGTITLKLLSIDGLFSRKDASTITNGYDWYRNRPVNNLVETIIDSETTLPGVSNISRKPDFATLDGSTAVSVFGRPPLWDGSVWRDDGFYTRALCFADIGSELTTPVIDGPALYLGCDDQLWAYFSSTGTYKLAYDFSTSGKTIKKLWYDATNDHLVVVLCEDEYWGSRATAISRTGWEFDVYYYTNDANPFGDKVIKCNTSTQYMCGLQYSIQPTKQAWVAADTSRWTGFGQQQYSTADWHFNENLRIPFGQHIHHTKNTDSDFGSGDIYHSWIYTDADGAIFEETNITDLYDTGDIRFESDGQIFYFTDRGYTTGGTFSYDAAGVYSLPNSPVIYYLGQDPCLLLSNQTVSSNLYMYYFTMTTDSSYDDNNYLSSTNNLDSSVVWFNLNVHAVNTTGVTNSVALPTTLAHSVPTCFTNNHTYDIAYLFVQQHTDSDTVPKACYCISVDLSKVDVTGAWDTDNPFGTAYSVVGSETGDNKYWTVLNCAFFTDNTTGTAFNSSDKAVAVLYNRSTGVYALCYCTADDFSSGQLYTDCTVLRTSQMPFMGIATDTVDDCIYIYGLGSGIVMQITSAGVLSQLHTAPVVSSEVGLLSGLAVNQSHDTGKPDIWGVTSPTVQLESYSTYAPGLYHLFRLHQSIADVIPYADFSGMTKMDAIKKLTQARDGLSFFDRHGNYHFLDRVYTSGTADYSLGLTSGGNADIAKVKLGLGYDRMYNYCKITPYGITFNPPNNDALTLLERPEKSNQERTDSSDISFVNYALEQKDTKRKVVYAYCEKTGTTTNGKSRWKYSLIQDMIDAETAQDYSASGTTVYLKSVFGGDDTEYGVHTGNFATMIDIETGESETSIITGVSSTNNTITISPAFTFSASRGTTITIGNTFRTGTSSKADWSNTGVTDTTASMTSGDTSCTCRSTENLSRGSIVQFNKDSIFDYRITDIVSATTFTFVLDSDRSSGLQESTVASGTVVIGYYSPDGTDGGLEIGGSRVFITWFAGSGTEDVDYTKTFIPGDRFVIDCPGLSLEPETASSQIAVDAASIQKHEKQEFTVDNCFLSRQVAMDMAKRIIYYNSNPRYQLEVTTPLIPQIDIVTTDGDLTQVNVTSPEVFPVSAGHTESFQICGYTHDPKNMTTTLYLSGLSDY